MTREKVIELLAEERKRSRDIAYAYKHEYDIKAIHGVASLKWHYEKIADICRQMGNSISGSNALSFDETIQDRIKRDYEKELLYFQPEAEQLEIQFDEKPQGAVIRVNSVTGCVLRMCRIPKELVFNENGEVREFVDITFPQPYKSKRILTGEMPRPCTCGKIPKVMLDTRLQAYHNSYYVVCECGKHSINAYDEKGDEYSKQLAIEIWNNEM